MRIDIPLQSLPVGTTAVYVRARFRGIPNSYWAAASVLPGNHVTISIPASSFVNGAALIGSDTLDATFDVEALDFDPSASAGGESAMSGILGASFHANVATNSGDAGCNPSLAAFDPTSFAPCGAGDLEWLRPGTSAIGIVLVHGWVPSVASWTDYYSAQGMTCSTSGPARTCNPSQRTSNPGLPGQNYFKELIAALKPDHNFDGVPIAVFNYESFHSIAQSGLDLAQKLKDVRQHGGVKQFVLIGHSMGGLVSRIAAQELEGVDKNAQTIIGIITLATPHLGTPAASQTAIFEIFASSLITPGTVGLALQWPRLELASLYLYGGDISGGDTRSLTDGLYWTYAAGYGYLCPHPASGSPDCINDGAVPSWSALPTSFGSLALARPLFTRYDHSQLAAGRTSPFSSDALYQLIRGDLTALIGRQGGISLAFGNQPTNGTVGQSLNPPVTVIVRDAAAQPLVAADFPVSLYLGATAGGAPLEVVTTDKGIATFSSIRIPSPGSGLTLTASVPWLGSVTSAPFNIAPSVAEIRASPTTTAFSATVGSVIPIAKTVSITNGGAGTLAGLSRGTITYTAGETSGWIGTATLNSTTDPATLTLQPNTTGLAPATYHAKVPISATGNVSNNPLEIPVTYTIGPPDLLGAPTLTLPIESATGVGITPTFSWTFVAGANRYWLLVATSQSAFPTDPTAGTCGSCVMAGFTSTTSHTLPNAFPNGNGGPPAGALSPSTHYYWEVQAFNNAITPHIVGQYSPAGSFTTTGGNLTFTSVSARGTETCAITLTLAPYCWGGNFNGELGDGTNTDHNTPVRVLGNLALPDLSVGEFHTCGLTSSGTAYCWGGNFNGELGDGTNTDRNMPVRVAGNLAFTRLSAGFITCGLTSNSSAYCWGDNFYGALGDGTNTNHNIPVQIAGGHAFTSLSAGTYHTCGLVSGNLAYCWGRNSGGQLGDGTTINRNAPVLVGGNHSFTSLSGGGSHTCGLTSGGAAYCWGANAFGQLGDGTNTTRSMPVSVAGNLAFTSLSTGGGHTCGLTTNNTVYCWGENEAGQLGDGTITNKSTPTRVSGNLMFTALSAGASHTCGMTTGGTLYCWGYNNDGELGDGTNSNRSFPTPVILP